MLNVNLSDFLDPFKARFDLPHSENTSQNLTLTTDPSIFFQIERDNPKVIVLFAPHFFIEMHLATTTKPFEIIMPTWNKTTTPMGIFWRWSGYNNLSDFDYLIPSSAVEMMPRNLYKNFLDTKSAMQQNDLRLYSCVRQRRVKLILSIETQQESIFNAYMRMGFESVMFF